MKEKVGMKMLVLYFLLGSFFLFSCEKGKTTLDEAENYFGSEDFEKAIPLYEKAFEEASTPLEQERIQLKIEQSYFELADQAFSKKEFQNSEEFSEQLLKQFPNSVYEKPVRKIFIQSRIERALLWMGQEKYPKAWEFLSGLEDYSQGLTELQEQIVELTARSLYEIAKEQLENQEYFLSLENLRVLTLEYPQTTWSEKAEETLDLVYFQDAKEQLRRGAYSNSLKAFKELLAQYPNTEYQKDAQKKIQEIETRLGEVSKKEVKRGQSLEKKGLDEKSPYGNGEILELIEELSLQQKKNTEYLVQEVFPKYAGRFVDLQAMEVLSYEPISKSQLLSGETRKWMDGFLGKQEEKENSPRYTDFSYQIRSETLGNVLFFVSKEDFFRLDFSEGSPKIDVEGQISELSLIGDNTKMDQNKEKAGKTIQVQIVVLNLQQSQ